jgi:hypothetical protein
VALIAVSITMSTVAFDLLSVGLVIAYLCQLATSQLPAIVLVRPPPFVCQLVSVPFASALVIIIIP